MHRLVIALTSLLGMAGAVVVGGYLLLSGAAADQAARLLPADTPLYVNLYLQPSAGQRANLEALVGRLPGFGDAASFDEKVDQIVQNLLAAADVDYRTEIRPWLGGQLALAVAPTGTDPSDGEALAIAAVKDRAEAEAALARLVGRSGGATTSETYEGVELVLDDEGGYAFVGDLLVFGTSPAQLRAAIDVERGARPSLAEDEGFASAMRSLPADHLASGYMDLAALAEAGGAPAVAGFSDAAFVLVAEGEALRIVGRTPIDASALDAATREALAVQGETATLAEWMPPDTRVAVSLFGLRQWLAAAEASAATTAQGTELTEALATIRALAAFGLGVDLDADLLPLLDGEAAIAVHQLPGDGTVPSGQLLLRPDDQAAAAALERVRDRLEERGLSVTEQTVAGVPVVSVTLPQVGELAYAVTDGVVIVGFSAGDVAAALEAHASGETLAAAEAYRRAFDLAGTPGGTRIYVDVGSLLAVAVAGEAVDIPADMRDILTELGSLAVTVPIRDDQIEFHAVLTLR